MRRLDHEPFEAAVGIDTGERYREMCRIIHEARKQEGYPWLTMGRFAVGMLMSEKTGLQGIPNRHGSIYPLPKDASDIVSARFDFEKNYPGGEPLLVLLHYNTDHPEIIGDQLNEAIEPIAEGIDGVQVNNLKFGRQVNSLTRFKREHPDVPVILQAHRKMLADLEPSEFAKKLSSVQDIVDYVWLDLSGGLGIDVDSSAMRPYIETIKIEVPAMMIGVAGGLNAQNLDEKIGPLLGDHPDLSWDSQTGVQYKSGDNKKFSEFYATVFLDDSEKLRHHYSANISD
jgi:phosphoribosylanthranilate isomerase